MRTHLSLTATVEGDKQYREAYLVLIGAQAKFVEENIDTSLSLIDLQNITDEGEEYFDEETMFKAYDAIMSSLPMNSVHARDIIQSLQNAGILFRERRMSVGSVDEEGAGKEAV